MPKEYKNEKPFRYLGKSGTVFTAERCDFRGGIKVQTPAQSREDLCSDVAEMIAHHAMFIWPELNGFSGYDHRKWEFVDTR